MKHPKTPAGQRLYAIGDIHGCVDLLCELIDSIIAYDTFRGPAESSTLIFLGDYIDRGPNSRGVIDVLISIASVMPSTVFLKGNHEALLETFLEDGNGFENWAVNGGVETLASYGISLASLNENWGNNSRIRALAKAAIPEAHLAFLRNLKLYETFGDYFFVHAGVMPGIPLDRQSEDHLLWIREPFLSHKGDFGKMIVHGHTPIPEPEKRPNRIGIDTGAFFTGKLTAVVLDGENHQFLSTEKRRP